MPKLTDNIPDSVFQKLRYKKDEDGFGDKNWTEWFRWITKDVNLERTISNVLTDATRDNLAKVWMENFAQNVQDVFKGKKIWQLPKLTTPALVVGAGPSIYAKNHLQILSDWARDLRRRSLLTIISTDRMLIPLLKHNIVPNYVVTVDGNRDKIEKFYDDPVLQNSSVEAILATTVAPNVLEACKKHGIKPVWFLPMLDQFNLTNNVTRLMYWMTGGATGVNCGGNAGSASWAIAHYLGAETIALIGLDYGYLAGTPIEQTAYYETLKPHMEDPSKLFAIYFDYYNTDFEIKCYSDIMFAHYKEAFLNMLILAENIRPSKTINCTEGGILNASGIKGMRLKDWLDTLDRQTVPAQIAN